MCALLWEVCYWPEADTLAWHPSSGAAQFGEIDIDSELVAKTEMLGVPAELLDRHGAVSAEVASAMASGAQQRAGVAHALAVTGVAGPTGGSEAKPVGTVWIAWATPSGTSAEVHRFPGDRRAVREATVVAALKGMLTRITSGT